MFKQHFGMKFNPFDKEIETNSLYISADIKELESRFKYIRDNRGIFLLVGEPGSGKSASLRKFAESLGPSLFRACYFSLTTITVNDFYRALTEILGEEPRSRKIDLFRQIQSAISTLYYEQRITPVIIIDEIHMASTAILDDLRMLFNFKMDSANPFILVLAGQPNIRNKLALNICQPLKQRIAVKYSMKGLTLLETDEYLKSRLAIAGVTSDIFTEQAIAGIHTSSNGFPRNINNLVVASLLFCASKSIDVVDEEAIYQASLEINQ